MSDTLSSPLQLGSSTIRNRVYRAPVLEGAGSGPDAAEKYATRLRAAAPSRRRRVTLIAGSWLGGKRNPFAPVWNRLLFREAKRRVPIPVFAVGGIRTGVEARQIVDDGEADMVGFGRPFYAQDDLAEHILGDGKFHALCQSSNMCVPAQMLGMKGVCYNPEVKKLQP